MRKDVAIISVVLSLGIAGSSSANAMDNSNSGSRMSERVLACAPCHGAEGEGSRGPYFPRLAGRPAGYLLNQFVNVRGSETPLLDQITV